MDIAKYSLTRSVNVWLLTLICVVGGILGLQNIARLEDPEFTIKQAQIITYYPGASAEKVEKELTEQIEIELQRMPQLNLLESTSEPGYSQIMFEVQSTYNSGKLPQIWDELRKHLRDIKSSLPNGATAPMVIDDFGDVFGLYYALTAPDFTPYQMREFARIIRREILTLDGVAKVNVRGIIEEQIVAEIDQFQIAGLGISFPDVMAVLDSNLKPFQGARLKVSDKQIRIPVDGFSNQLEEIENFSIVVPGKNVSIRIKDIATLSIEPVDTPSSLIRFNGESAVTLGISAVGGVNIVEIGTVVEQKINQLLATLPAGIELSPIYNQAKVVDQAVDGFVLNLEISVAVVTLALCVFMGWRSGVVVGGTLIVTIMGTILLMWLSGLQLQRISLGAMVIAMGMLVDNAIVVAEGMMLRMEKGKSALESASYIVKRTQWPLLGATIIGIAAFSGIGLSNDATGEFLFSLFAVVLISLMLSWILAVSLTPLLGKYFYQVKQSQQQEKQTILHKGYSALLLTALKFKWLSVVVLFAITIIGYASFGLIKQGFFPPSNTPVFFIDYWGPQDRDIRATERFVKQAEKVIMAHSDVVSTTSFIGQGSERFVLIISPELPNESYGMFMVRTDDSSKIPRMINELTAKLQQIDSDGEFYGKMLQFGPAAGAKIEARFSGNDPVILRELAEQARAVYRDSRLIKDIRDDWRQKGIMLTPEYDDIAAGIAGVSRNDFMQAIQYATSGLRIGQLQDGDYLYPIIAKHSKDKNSTLEDLNNALVWSSSQRKYVPLRQISGDVQYDSEEVLVRRRDRVRTITIAGEPVDGTTAAKARLSVLQQIESIQLPQGYQLEWGGEYETSRDAQQRLGSGLPVGLLVMFIISVLLFGRVRQPLIIWLLVPMALVGIVAGLLIADLPFGFMSLLAFISLWGMLIKNVIVLLEEIDLQIADGINKTQAVVAASVSRLRPVSLAAITTILGVFPLVTDAFFADMAVSIIGGLSFATLLTLIAVPVLYSVFYKISFKR